MSEKRMLASNPEYETYNEIWNLYAIAKNPAMWMNENDLEMYDVLDIEDILFECMEELLEGLPAVFLENKYKIKDQDE